MSQVDMVDVKALIEPVMQLHGGNQSALLPALHALQSKYGFIDPAFHLVLADVFNISQAEVKGVVSFYHDFRVKPHGNHLLRICQAEACQSVGARRITQFVKDLTGLELGETSDDGNLTVEAVYCLGLCAAGPAVDMDGAHVARVDDDKITALVAATREDHLS